MKHELQDILVTREPTSWSYRVDVKCSCGLLASEYGYPDRRLADRARLRIEQHIAIEDGKDILHA